MRSQITELSCAARTKILPILMALDRIIQVFSSWDYFFKDQFIWGEEGGRKKEVLLTCTPPPQKFGVHQKKSKKFRARLYLKSYSICVLLICGFGVQIPDLPVFRVQQPTHSYFM